MTENEISYLIRGAIFKVYNALGPGLLESVYEHVLCYELQQLGLNIVQQAPMPLVYNEVKMDIGYRMDIVVEDKVVIEVKSVAELADVHHKQVLTYLKLSGKKLALLVNFNSAEIEKAIIRKVNGL